MDAPAAMGWTCNVPCPARDTAGTLVRSSLVEVWSESMSTAELLQAWRDAIRAAELAERLATVAAQASANAEIQSAEADEIATLAEEAAARAQVAAERARAFATSVGMSAAGLRDQAGASQHTSETMRRIEGEARSAFHDAEAQAREAHEPTGPDGQPHRAI
jgi:methyl-accepting chemotaxis protein